MIQKRRTCFETIRHCSNVHFWKKVIGKVGLDVDCHGRVNRVQTAHLLPQILHPALSILCSNRLPKTWRVELPLCCRCEIRHPVGISEWPLLMSDQEKSFCPPDSIFRVNRVRQQSSKNCGRGTEKAKRPHLIRDSSRRIPVVPGKAFIPTIAIERNSHSGPGYF